MSFRISRFEQGSAYHRRRYNFTKPKSGNDTVSADNSNPGAKTVDAVLKGFTDVTTHVVSKGEPVAISGFCKFSKVERAARMGRNPATGETIQIGAKTVVKFRVAKAAKEAIL